MSAQLPEPIAIVGSGCRFPGSSTTPSALWKLLSKPRDVSKEIFDDRFELRGHYHPKGPNHGTTNVQRAYFVDQDPRLFDAAFFNISPNEAESIDPQQRLLMEVVYEALEAGGHALEEMRGSDTAFYVGTMSVDYNDIVLRDPESMPTYFATGASRAVISNRVSYFFDWHGPSMTIDTACSSSLVALHLAVQSLRSGESRVAVAGGTNLLLAPDQFVGESNMSMLSPLGHSRMWDADADGYARGDGIAALVIKKLSDAIADGDHIESIIRETGVNQDGKSTGLTVPSSEAQAALIRETYAKAGLDISKPQNWPQYFEAHGTGTKAGDPREAAAIYRCFGSQSANGNPLYVGSIKTLIGHTEGTAGLAGVIKASLSVQSGVIAPNMYLDRLNPDIKQYYDHLRVPTTPTQWPALPDGAPRRVSVNSFGFGGTNAHAIIENFQPPTNGMISMPEAEAKPFTPFTFSAATEESLIDLLQRYSNFLKTDFTGNLRDLAWTLQSRKSALTFKAAFSASTLEELVSKIDGKLSQVNQDSSKVLGTRSVPAKPRVLGVFTGQGAQWPSMGAQLIRHSANVRKKLAELDQSLATLPEGDRPTWKIAEQLSAGKDTSRIAEAALSQPLCTAVQIVLVDLLQSAGIEFAAVVGHSSGEIGAAYAANMISAHDAIRIAYYRGLYAKLAKGPDGQRGAMLAVGTSWEDAEELIELPAFEGRVKIAAQNSAASLTLSGDDDGVEHAKRVFLEEKKFARELRVDTAYHSHHMLPASHPYVQSLKACGVHVNRNRNSSCVWYSSVKPGDPMGPTNELHDLYWRDNMVNAVLFAPAVERAAADEDINIALEIGPHPALKGPAQQTISGLRSAPLPYTGTLSRGVDDIDALSDALGFIWAQLGQGSVDFESYQSAVSPAPLPKLVAGLPAYPWNHKRPYLHESRIAKKRRVRGSSYHELLGVPDANNTERVLRWRNFLKSSEIRWLDGHQLQGQSVFPAAGYVAMALEAGKKLAGDRNVQVLEVRDLVIGKAITFDEGANFAAETLVSLTDITPIGKSLLSTQTANFSVYSCPNTGTVHMDLVAEGTIKIVYGTPSFTALSSMPLDSDNFTTVDQDAFYQSLLDLGYGYNGPFRTLHSLKRRLGQASASVSTYEYADEEDILTVHPTMLDVAFQASFLALSVPGDERLWSLHVPTSIGCIRVNPELCASLPMSSTTLPLSTVLHEPDSASFSSSIDVFSRDGRQTLIQVEKLSLKPFSPATEADDRPVYSMTRYGHIEPNAHSLLSGQGIDHPSEDEAAIATLGERLAYHYLRTYNPSGTMPHQPLQELADQVLLSRNSGRLLSVKKEWDNDNYDQIESLLARYPESADLNALQAITQGKTLQKGIDDNALDRLYEDGIGFATYNTFLARLLQQVSHRYPHANILEVGARSGHATKSVFDAIGSTYASYTYTDPSQDQIEKAGKLLGAHNPKVAFHVFEHDVPASSSDGLKEQAYDVIIASNALHSTTTPEEMLTRLRRFLKPGGYLLLSGVIGNAPLRIQLLMAGGVLPFCPGTSGDSRKRTAMWHNALRKSGFSGIDTITPEINGLVWPLSVFAAQAVDNKVSLLRKPLSSSTSLQVHELVILGNTSLRTSQLAESISDLLGPLCGKVTLIQGLPTDDDDITPMSTFINLVDLDEPIFEDFNEIAMEGLKRLFELANNIVWVTHGARADQPYHNASIGFGRALAYEMPHMFLQFLDLDVFEGENVSRLVAEAALRLAAVSEWDAKGNRDKLLWSKEPELFLEKGQLMIPRVIDRKDRNGRINALRRTVTNIVDPKVTSVSIIQASDTSLALQQDLSPARSEHGSNTIDVTHSVLFSLKVSPEAFLYLGLGYEKASGNTVVTASTTLGSRVAGIASVPVKVGTDEASAFLAATTAEILATALLSETPAHSHVLVHEPFDHEFLKALKRRASQKEVALSFSTTKDVESHLEDGAVWIRLSAWTSTHIVKRSIPSHVTHFANLAVDEEAFGAAATIRECLPTGIKEISNTGLLRQPSASLQPATDSATLTQALVDAVRPVEEENTQRNRPSRSKPPVILPSEISNTSFASMLPHTVIDWTVDRTLSVQVQPIDASQLFSRNKTYLLVGLTGEVGQSICEWMARHGAGHICLTSRNPQPNLKWEASIKDLGASVKFFAMDVTQKEDVERVVTEIRATYPPIAGVANGAALFRDTPFSEMSLEMMQDVLKPKIDGTNFLDALFSEPDLDFFIVFSSIASIFGNSAQSNYCAANGYMSGICNQRRKRGLAATSLEIGRVMGIGYVERAGQKAKDQLVRFGAMAISETDLHHLMAEAVLASAPSSNIDASITTGCRTVPFEEEPRVAWFDNPRFGHKIIIGASVGFDKGDGSRNLPVRDQLATATTSEQALDIIQDCFAAKLATISQLTEVSRTVPLVELGIDSLVAVEVRGWFLKELKTDMPVLKVLGGGSVEDLSTQALEKMPQDLLPNVGKTTSTAAQDANPKPKASVPPAAAQPKARVAETLSTDGAAKRGSTSSSHPSEDSTSASDSESSTPSTRRSQIATPATAVTAGSSSVDLVGAARKTLELQHIMEAERASFVKSELISFPQSRFWFLEKLLDDHTTFNINIFSRITGNLRIGDLERAVRLVGARHESLRTCFVAHEEEADLAYQKVLPRSLLRLERKDVGSFEQVQAEYEAIKTYPYDLSRGDLMRLILLSLSPTEHYLIIGYHHILMDGVSFQVFLSDLERAYQRQPLGASPLQLPDLSRKQRAAFETGAMGEEIAYWRSEFPDGHPLLPLFPMAKVVSRSPMKSFKVNQVTLWVKAGVAALVRQKAMALRATTFHFHMAVFRTMLYRLTGAKDLTIGIADANRSSSEDLTGVIGLLLNLLTLRFKAVSRQRFMDSVAEARDKTYGALQNSSVPFDVLLTELNTSRSPSYSPCFQAFFDYRQGAQEKRKFGSTDLQFIELHPGRTAYDITLDITESSESLVILLRTQSSLYDQAATQLLADTYVQLLEVFTADTSMLLDEPPLYSVTSLKDAVNVGRGPSLESSWPGGTLPHRIDQVIEDNKDKIALKDGHGGLFTYEALSNRIQAIAQGLQKVNVGIGSRVLVYQDATVDWPASMLAIMRLGAIYIPLDLRNPLARLADVASSCQPAAILIDSSTASTVTQVNVTGAHVINVGELTFKSTAPVANVAKPELEAAILFTSGSTGRPKGIIVKASGLRNEIEGYTTQWGLKAERVLQQSAFTFNHSSDQIYTGLVNGGSVYIVPWSKRGDPIEITKIIAEEGITYTKATPAEYLMWLDYGHANLTQASEWRFAFGGGESLTSPVLDKLKALDLPLLRFFNSYGPTEISISSTKMEIHYREEQPEGRIPCGYSLPNYAAYILDEQRNPLPVGVPGELWIGGAGVSLGYLDDKDLTDSHFVADPFATPEYIAQGWTRMYRTGDIAHLQPDGAMVFHRRVAHDTQLKIRGLRIELGDIESNIVKASQGTLREAAVTLRNADSDSPLLIAHVVFSPQHTVDDTKEYLQDLLSALEVPQYMVPAMAIPLERMPLNNHSKVDRAALAALPLPKHHGKKEASDRSSELTETMVQLTRLWGDVLGARQLGIDIDSSTNFFDVGGNSLLIVRLQSRIHTAFGVTLRLVDLLGANKLKDMAKLVEKAAAVAAGSGDVDWAQELKLFDSSALVQVVGPTKQPLKTTDRDILITGAGGFLGKHILAKLVQDESVSRIHCIGLRARPADAGTPRTLAVSSPKIVTYTGDLSEPRLGLSEADYLALARNVDVILHMGAVRSFWDSYHLLRASNVTPTKELIRLATARHIPIHYVSTAGVLGHGSDEDGVGILAAASVRDHPPRTTGGANGYVASRWASEQLLELASRGSSSSGAVLQVPTTIHRFIPSKTPSREATDAATAELLGFAEQISALPEFSGSGYFELTHVEKASTELCRSLLAVGGDGDETHEARFRHHECEVHIDIEDLRARLGSWRVSKDDEKLGTIPGLSFVGKAKALGLKWFVTSHTLFMAEKGGEKETGDAILESRR